MNLYLQCTETKKQTGHGLTYTKKSVSSKLLKFIEHLLRTRHFPLILHLAPRVNFQHSNQSDPLNMSSPLLRTLQWLPMILGLKVKLFTADYIRPYPTRTSSLIFSCLPSLSLLPNYTGFFSSSDIPATLTTGPWHLFSLPGTSLS